MGWILQRDLPHDPLRRVLPRAPVREQRDVAWSGSCRWNELGDVWVMNLCLPRNIALSFSHATEIQPGSVGSKGAAVDKGFLRPEFVYRALNSDNT